MAKIVRNFLSGRMNKMVDEKLVPNGEYIHAINCRLTSSEGAEIGVIENSKGNIFLTDLEYEGDKFSSSALVIGALADSARETLYWLVHDSNFTSSPTGKLDVILSFNVRTGVLTRHVLSIRNGFDTSNTTLNFNPQYLVTGINIVDDLLFFTDNYNPPRYININRNYAEPDLLSNIDMFFADEILVIKAPPKEPLGISTIISFSEDAFMEDRFLSFAYRYRYEDNTHSATSQFSEPAFIPKGFLFSPESFLNEGMINQVTSVGLTYNTGGRNVLEVELLFKEVQNNIIRVIEKINVAEINDNTQTYVFSNSKIFTILRDSEILRLYDNVPLLAKAQTIMGNRIMYGNYVEGYDVDDIDIDYSVSPIRLEIGNDELLITTIAGLYDIDPNSLSKSIPDSVFGIDLSGFNLVQGSAIIIDITYEHEEFTGNVTPFGQSSSKELNFTYVLPQDFGSAFELATSIGFQNAVSLLKVPFATACTGSTFTDQFNCAVDTPFGYSGGQLDALDSGVTALAGQIEILADPASVVIAFQIPAVYYQDTINPANYAVEYYTITEATSGFLSVGNPSSLHSNRGYEVGIVYMDEFKRSSLPLVSNDNTVRFNCGDSVTQNKIRATIPYLPPAWAKSYKFVVKADKEGYDTIYSNLFVSTDGAPNMVWFLLDGENARKVEDGTRLIVKADTGGATSRCTYCTVLEKKSQPADFLGTTYPSPAGAYMRINANNFAATPSENAVIDFGLQTTTQSKAGNSVIYPIGNYPLGIEDPTTPGSFIDYTIPAGSRIQLSFEFERRGTGSRCNKRNYTYDKTFFAISDHDNFLDWWEDADIQATLNSGRSDIGGNPSGTINNVYVPGLATTPTDIPTNIATNYYRFYRAPSGLLSLLVTGTQVCTGFDRSEKRASTVKLKIVVFRAINNIIWETEPQDTLPNVFFEGSQVFQINSGFHSGNVQTQTSSVPAIVDLSFTNCWTFGNGAESYKIRDSILGKTTNLGNRIYATGEEEYKRSHRFADITYSGIYNDESNLNRLNEFNLGLANFKILERLFGRIQILDGRETDVRVLQEDKISYVLAGKNLLSDSAAGGVISSVPEVLGTQIARIEEFGISNNPESFTKWGSGAYFTDAKRGSVLMLKGGSAQSEQLVEISELGMRNWYRDLFIDSFHTQKLGGYDPYMDEYVLASNNRTLPSVGGCASCGVSQTFKIDEGSDFEYCVNLGSLVGDAELFYNLISVGTIKVDVVYNAIPYTTGNVTASGSIVIPKTSIAANTMTVKLSSIVGNAILEIIPSCPDAEELKVVEISVGNDIDADQTIHNEYRYISGTFVSQNNRSFVELLPGGEPKVVSQFTVTTALQGTQVSPVDGSLVRVTSNRLGEDDFVFDPSVNKLMYLRTNVEYTNNATDINALLAAAINITPIQGADPAFYGEFTMPTGGGEYLYLVWNYLRSYEEQICFSATKTRQLSCCACSI